VIKGIFNRIASYYKTIAILLTMFACPASYSQTIPSSADPARIKPQEPIITEAPSKDANIPEIPEYDQHIIMPKNASKISFTMKELDINGVSSFVEFDLLPIYEEYLNKEITLDVIWKIAADITKNYQNKGYFLSKAYVPAQKLKSDKVIINVTEGSVDKVEVDEKYAKKMVFNKLIKRLVDNKPIKDSDLESFILQINSFPGVEFNAVIEPSENEGMVKLSLQKVKNKKSSTSITVDNYGSRFIGPYQSTLTYKNSFLPLHETTISLLASVPFDELKYISFAHELPIYPDWKAQFSSNYVKSRPGFSLENSDIRSQYVEIGLDIIWQPIRARDMNLSFSFGINGKNVNGDILADEPLTRDRIRKTKYKINYDGSDRLRGYNYFDFGIEQGLHLLGSSDIGESNLSRSGASPDFSKVTYNYTRIQVLPQKFTAIGRLSGQFAFEPLYSSEEFGYGGSLFGRAFDSSEITGDSGISASLELRYNGIDKIKNIKIVPYGFYDIGKVWNEDIGGVGDSAASVGFGTQIAISKKFNANLGIAYPLIRPINTPQYGNGKNPRYMIQFSYEF